MQIKRTIWNGVQGTVLEFGREFTKGELMGIAIREIVGEPDDAVGIVDDDYREGHNLAGEVPKKNMPTGKAGKKAEGSEENF